MEPAADVQPLEEAPVHARSFRHVVPDGLPLALAGLHRSLAVGEKVEVEAAGPAGFWTADRLEDVLVGGGFTVTGVEVGGDALRARARRDRTLPDTVGPGMKVLVSGLNPSLVAADAGYGYAGATNRFWPAAEEAGLVSRPRDPVAALAADGVGMTDLVKRPTARAEELDGTEYVAGARRVEELAGWLQPRLVLFVGLAGWRAVVDRRAGPGIQPGRFGGARAYVMPSTSGLNARSRLDDLVGHLRAALAEAARP